MQDATLWQTVLGEIELSVSRGNFVTWFKNTQLLRHRDDVVIVGVPNIFVKNQLERKFNDLILSVLEKNGVKPEQIEYKIHTASSAPVIDEPVVLTSPADEISANQPQPQNKSGVSHSYRQGLNERYTFENFVVGNNNNFAHAAAFAVARPGADICASARFIRIPHFLYSVAVAPRAVHGQEEWPTGPPAPSQWS